MGLARVDGEWSNGCDAVHSTPRRSRDFAGPTMLDRWFSVIKLPMSWRQFHRLPRNPAYKYEYSDKHGVVVAAAEVLQRAAGVAAPARRPAPGDRGRSRGRPVPPPGGSRLAAAVAAVRRVVPPGPAVRQPGRSATAGGGAGLPEIHAGRPRRPDHPPRLPRGLDEEDGHPVGAAPGDPRAAGGPRRFLDLPLEDAAAAGLHRTAARPRPPHLDLRRPPVRRLRVGTALLAHASREPHRAGIHRADQLVHPGQRVEHALALAQRLRAPALLRLAAAIPRDDAGKRRRPKPEPQQAGTHPAP